MEIVQSVHMIEGINAHCYLIDGPDLVLIDTGMPRKTKKILQYITDTLQRNPKDLKFIVLTHCDIDHIGNASELRRITGATIVAHSSDADIIAGKKPRQTPQRIMSILFKILGVFLQVKPFLVDEIIDDGDMIAGLTVLHLPGHTPGSIGLYDPKRKIVFVGDTLGCKNGELQSPPKSVTWDMKLVHRSIKKLQPLDFMVLLSGHGEPITSHASIKFKQFMTDLQKNTTT